MRYTEARLSKISVEMLADIYKDTVDFIPNFDETEKEPTVLPSRFPNLLVNGGTGIAVGMATNIPPHNLREVIAAVVKIIDNQVEEGRQTSMEEVLQIIKGPDFPTGAEILGTRGIEEAYRTGRGKIRVRAVTNIETAPNGKSHIIVTELPYLVNKARLIEKIAELVKTKKIDGITGITDESNREGIRINIELRRDVNANVLLNQLLKHTQLQDSFGVIMLALVNNEPKVLNILQMLEYYLDHQKDVVTRRTKYDLNKAEERAHILEGLLKALDHIDEVIRIIRGSANVAEAKRELMERFELTDPQAQAIVDMRLRALTGLEREKIENEYRELEERIAYYKELLADPEKIKVAGLDAHLGAERGHLLVGEELDDRARDGAVLAEGDPGQALGAKRGSHAGELIDLGTGPGAGTLGVDGLDDAAALKGGGEDLEAAVLDDLGQVDELHAKAAVRAVDAVLVHGVGVLDAVQREADVGDALLCEDLCHDVLHHLHDVVFCDVGHLDVDLGELGLAISA